MAASPRVARAGAPRVAVVGAGVAGLACARSLLAAGLRVLVYDGARSCGGRVATFQGRYGAFDHGAQYFTVQSHAFQPEVDRWQSAGRVAPWAGRVIAFTAGAAVDQGPLCQRFVAIPGMQRLAEEIAAGVELQLGTSVEGLRRTAAGWRLLDPSVADLALASFDAVCLAIPSDLGARLLSGASPIAQAAATVQWEPCWTTLLALAQPTAVDFDGAFFNDDSVLAWAARDSGKPGRVPVDGVAERWVLQARPKWSRDALATAHDVVGPWMARAFAARIGRALPAHATVAVLWRRATPMNPLAGSHLWDREARVGMAGDWCGGARVEGAWLSGRALGAAVVESLCA